jgi:hypothetical protein
LRQGETIFLISGRSYLEKIRMDCAFTTIIQKFQRVRTLQTVVGKAAFSCMRFTEINHHVKSVTWDLDGIYFAHLTLQKTRRCLWKE